MLEVNGLRKSILDREKTYFPGSRANSNMDLGFSYTFCDPDYSWEPFFMYIFDGNRTPKSKKKKTRKYQDDWPKKDLLKGKGHSMVLNMIDTFGDSKREKGFILLTGNTFLSETEKFVEKSILKRSPSKATKSHPRLLQRKPTLEDSINLETFGNLCVQSAISSRRKKDDDCKTDWPKGPDIPSAERLNIWLPQLPQVSSSPSPVVPIPIPTTPRILDIDVNGRMRAAQRALSRVKRLPYPVNYASAVDLHSTKAVIACGSL